MSQTSATIDSPSLIRIFGVLISYAVVSAILGILYSEAIWYSPLPNLNLLFLLSYAFLTSFIAGFSIRIFKARFPMDASLFAVAGSVLGFYVSWAAWLSLVHNSLKIDQYWFGWVIDSKFDPETILYFLTNPSVMWGLAAGVYREGLWVFRLFTPVSGLMILLIWATEFFLFGVMTAMRAWKKSRLLMIGP
jgi:hypothetical protein